MSGNGADIGFGEGALGATSSVGRVVELCDRIDDLFALFDFAFFGTFLGRCLIVFKIDWSFWPWFRERGGCKPG
jgi:hypothetical protein